MLLTEDQLLLGWRQSKKNQWTHKNLYLLSGTSLHNWLASHIYLQGYPFQTE